MTDGVWIDGAGKIVSVVHGYSKGTKAAATFVPLSHVRGLAVGQKAPTAASQQLAATDSEMSRGIEDLAALLISKGTIARADLPAQLLEKINARRTLRGEKAL